METSLIPDELLRDLKQDNRLMQIVRRSQPNRDYPIKIRKSSEDFFTKARSTTCSEQAIQCIYTNMPALWRAKRIVSKTQLPDKLQLFEPNGYWRIRVRKFIKDHHIIQDTQICPLIRTHNATCHYERRQDGSNILRFQIHTPQEFDFEDLNQGMIWIKVACRNFGDLLDALDNLCIYEEMYEVNNRTPNIIVDCDMPPLFLIAIERFLSEYLIAVEQIKIEAYEALPNKDQVSESDYKKYIAPFIDAVKKATQRFIAVKKLLDRANVSNTERVNRLKGTIHNANTLFWSYTMLDYLWREQLKKTSEIHDIQALNGSPTLSKLLYQSVVLARAAFPDKEVGVTISEDKIIMETEINSYGNDLQNILINLLTNSIKYRGKLIRMKVRKGEHNEITITVSDDGKGMTPAQIDQCTKQGWRADSDVSGDGLGLFWVQNKVAELEGTMDISSKPGIGTTVTISIPLSKIISKR